jgi:hypothetical protein
MARRPKDGDIFAIGTSRGTAYVQQICREPQWGSLIRILPGIYGETPDLRQLISQPERFMTFFPLGAALNRRLVQHVGQSEIPVHARSFPLFRAAGGVDREGRVHDWYLWDGKREWRVGKLTPEMRRYPIREVINDTLLIARIESGWTPETDNTREAL